jgi:acyl-CoA thioesterase YciA
MPRDASKPHGELTIRTLAMPSDTNPRGDIFGGWLMSQMDIAGGVASSQRAHGRTVTVAVEGMVFHEPVKVGNVLCCYTDILKVGTTSITVGIEAWALNQDVKSRVKVTEAIFTYVAVDDNGNKRPIPPE